MSSRLGQHSLLLLRCSYHIKAQCQTLCRSEAQYVFLIAGSHSNQILKVRNRLLGSNPRYTGIMQSYAFHLIRGGFLISLFPECLKSFVNSKSIHAENLKFLARVVVSLAVRCLIPRVESEKSKIIYARFLMNDWRPGWRRRYM